ncbi:MAG UNVERIFIED_CONTAM: hypothetical protein LVQ98_09635 [Rickettsiaceae bacterium]
MLGLSKGIFSAGESAIAKLYIIEDKDNRTAFAASYMYQASSMAGIIIASLASSVVIIFDYNGLWRICFILGGILGIVGYSLRKSSNIYLNKSQEKRGKVSLSILWSYRYKLLAIIFTTGFSHITYLVPCVVMNSLMPFITDVSIKEMMGLNNIMVILDMMLILIIGPLLSKHSYFNVKIISSIIIFITIPILFMYLPGSGLWYVTFVRVWIVLWGVIFMCPQNLFYKKLFDNVPESYLIVGVANAIGAGVIGKLSPALIMYLWYEYQNMLVVGLYVSIISFFTSYFVYKSHQN